MGQFHDHMGHRLFAVDSGGNGDVLLLIHGFPTSSWDYAPMYEALASERRVIAPDLLGFGYSDKPARHEYSIMEQADLVCALLDKLEAARVGILAHDYGDTVAQELLARHNERSLRTRLDHVCFLNGGLFPETHRPRFVQKLLLSPVGPLVSRAMSKQAFERAMRGIFSRNRPPSANELDSFWQLANENDGLRIAHRLIRYMPERVRHRERWVSALIEARTPVALIDGTEDPVSGEHMVQRFEEIAGRRHFIRRLDGVGHYPQVESPQAVLDAYREFVAGIPRVANA